MLIVAGRGNVRRSRSATLASVLAVAAIACASGCGSGGATQASAAPVASDPAGGTGSYILTATDTGNGYEPTFTGNGELGVRVPPTGQGYAAGTVPAQSELAGFYAEPPGGVQQRANIPTWSTLTFSDGGQAFTTTTGRTGDWNQSIDLRTGVITTSADWTAPDGHTTALTYQVLTDRARADVGLVRLQLTPQWSGTATVTDAIDGSPATSSTQVDKGWSPPDQVDWVEVQAMGSGTVAAIASQLGTSADVTAPVTPVDQNTEQSVGQQTAFPVTAGQTYTFTKYVGVATSPGTGDPIAEARAQAHDAAAEGFASLVAANDAAWAALWSGRIDVVGDPSLATDVNASEFYLWSSTRDGVDWSITPAGLSSNGYNGHVFWDADTWMYPALLAQHPDLASEMDTYRYRRLSAAEQHAAATDYRGARFPWESAIDGTEQIPPPASLFTEGLYEQHITADVALAQWQYYLATGDRTWLAERGWPVLSEAAAFWASRVNPGADGSYHINGVTGPDEENVDVDDEAYTNAAARTTLDDAVQAADVLGLTPPPDWARIASGIVVPVDTSSGIVPEFSGYDGGMVKQADVTLLEYPLDYPLPTGVAGNDVDYYAPRTDPSGPSMSDAVNSIDTSATGAPGCASLVYTERSVQPFIRDDFDQFSETSTGGVLTFMTGIGGFLQEFLYGYSGLRLTADSVRLAPSLTGQLGGVVLHDLSWHGRRFTVAVGRHSTSITLERGPTLPVSTPSGQRTVAVGQTMTIPTRRPDLSSTTDALRCGGATATNSMPGSPPLAAVDGSTATDWQPEALPATVVAPVTDGLRTLSTVTLKWGQVWTPPTLDQTTTSDTSTVLRATAYTVALSSDGHTWHTVATVSDRTTGTTDVLHFAPTPARYVSVQMTSSSGARPPMLDELTAG